MSSKWRSISHTSQSMLLSSMRKENSETLLMRERSLKKFSFPEEKRSLNRFSAESMISVLKMSIEPSES